MRLAGQWIAKVRRVSGHFRSGIETMIREAELEEMERKWREQNEAIMKAHPAAQDSWSEAALPPPEPPVGLPVEPASAERGKQDQAEPQLPLPPP
jgi:sec-independent protein translocase protein TatB